MNIFILDKDPLKAAASHCDKHVVKMIAEYSQLLSEYCREFHNRDTGILLPQSNRNHPAYLWLKEGTGNYCYLLKLLSSLCDRYTKIYGRVHSYQEDANDLLMIPYFEADPRDRLYISTIPRLIMPDYVYHLAGITDNNKEQGNYCIDDVVRAYRILYMTEKRRILLWNKKTIGPDWLEEYNKFRMVDVTKLLDNVLITANNNLTDKRSKDSKNGEGELIE